MTLDPPAAAARRQWVLDRIVEDLVGWGCPLDSAPARARQLLDRALDGGYALPTALQPPAPRGGGSTPEGRELARRILEQSRAGCHCGPAHLGHRGEDHLPGCPVRTAHDRGTQIGHAPTQQPAGQDRQASRTIGTPPGFRHGVTPDERTAP